MPDAKILIVDDHEDTLYALESALAPLGYQLGRATSGDEALKQVLRGQVGLLVLDVRMPRVGGLEVVRYMRRVEQTQHIPVVLVTGFGSDHELTSAAFGLGVADLVMKPVDPWVLRTKVRYLYDARRRQLALEQEIRELRALVKEHPGAAGTDEPGPRAALPHPDPRVPPQRASEAHDGELEQDRT
ncbi:response regulator [Streptomyces panaciradicis]|uniref:response regulator n=1 Tax=Streptomyces panaciradicis TaxID=1470261 RepID=UPI00201CF4C6|nr:response regulator [Streptomyces panaciradicis]MCL6667174.1 response regulator [Streptomyces panaciradicis]